MSDHCNWCEFLPQNKQRLPADPLSRSRGSCGKVTMEETLRLRVGLRGPTPWAPRPGNGSSSDYPFSSIHPIHHCPQTAPCFSWTFLCPARLWCSLLPSIKVYQSTLIWIHQMTTVCLTASKIAKCKTNRQKSLLCMCSRVSEQYDLLTVNW